MMYVDKDGKLLIETDNIKKNIPKSANGICIESDDLKIEFHIDETGNEYILYEDYKRKMTNESILYWKKYISHNVNELKKSLNIQYFVVKFNDKKQVMIWGKNEK